MQLFFEFRDTQVHLVIGGFGLWVEYDLFRDAKFAVHNNGDTPAAFNHQTHFAVQGIDARVGCGVSGTGVVGVCDQLTNAIPNAVLEATTARGAKTGFLNRKAVI